MPGLFALPLDTRLSERIEELTPTELALVPFNTSCTDVVFLERAALRFRRLARDYQAVLSSTQLPSPSLSPSLASTDPFSSPTSSALPQDGGSDGNLAAESCSFSWGDELARALGPVKVKLEEDEIVIASRDQPLLSFSTARFASSCVRSCDQTCLPGDLLTYAPSSFGQISREKLRESTKR